ncbi:PucR family transcriptional regulator [Robertmurraya massiliosenegalensis]|uniref:PucR family transcriptional regulator n=1 Tax=Robertmurraya massiliosenegalensis TaxID=1287657 RepID=UPI0002E838DF|nr:PucR family transcriptional regulator ligand-binding domain-containing protein [Robertmurraya massiliosenegalensis]
MGVPLKKLMNIGGLRNCKIIAGQQGVERIVTNVTIMEVPDIVQWLRGNELLITSLYPIKDDLDDQIQLIEKLYKAGTTALAIKPVRFIDAIPEEMKKKADEMGITLIEIPEEISYLDILSPAMHAIFNDKIVLQEDLEHATRVLNEISIAKGDFNQFIQTLSYLTKSKVLLESNVPYIPVHEQLESLLPMTPQQIKELEVVQRPIRMIRKGREKNEESCIVTPIIIDGELYGNITCWSYHSQFMEVDLAIQEKAATLLSVEFLKKKIKYDIEQHYKNDFIRDLLFSEDKNIEHLLEKGRIYNLHESNPYVCMVVAEKELQQEDLFSRNINQLEKGIKELDPHIICAVYRRYLLMIVPMRNRVTQDFRKILDSLLLLIEQRVHTRIRIGVGSTYLGIQGLRKSYHEAQKTITLGPRLWMKKSIIFHSELGVYRLIAQIENHAELTDFYGDVIKRIIDYDKEYEFELTTTLETYFKCNESLKETAKALFIHVNTLKYRLQKIRQITGLNLQKSEDKLLIHLGLKIHQYFEPSVEGSRKKSLFLNQ